MQRWSGDGRAVVMYSYYSLYGRYSRSMYTLYDSLSLNRNDNCSIIENLCASKVFLAKKFSRFCLPAMFSLVSCANTRTPFVVVLGTLNCIVVLWNRSVWPIDEIEKLSGFSCFWREKIIGGVDFQKKIRLIVFDKRNRFIDLKKRLTWSYQK